MIRNIRDGVQCQEHSSLGAERPLFIIHLYKSQVFFFFFLLIWNGDIGYSLIGFLWELTEIIRKKYFVNSKSKTNIGLKYLEGCHMSEKLNLFFGSPENRIKSMDRNYHIQLSAQQKEEML